MKNLIWITLSLVSIPVLPQAAQLPIFAKELEQFKKEITSTINRLESDIKSLQVRIAQAEQKLNIPQPTPSPVPTPVPSHTK